jgi:flagellar basal body-associated protein FliL
MIVGEIILQILLLIGAAIVGGVTYGLVMVQIDKYQNKKELKEQKEYYERYAEYRKKQMKARGKAKVK